MTTYAEAGVDLDRGSAITQRLAAIVARTRGAGVLADVGAFGGQLALDGWGGVRDPVLVASTDGVGTKVKVAAALGRYDTLGRDIVNHCVNDVAVQGASPLFFLDYLALHHADPAVVAALVEGVAAACQAAGCALLGGETAEMPDVYPPGEFDLAGFAVGIVARSAIGRNGAPSAGDVLLGLPSDGLHTNGYSLARRVLPPETWGREEPALGRTVGEALLAPHRLYLDQIRALTAAGARAFAHVTGGGLPENVARVLPAEVAAEIDLDRWQPPPIFRLIADTGRIPRDELYRVFNMGIGLVAVVPRDRLAAAVAAAPEGRAIGSVVAREEGGAVRLVGAGYSGSAGDEGGRPMSVGAAVADGERLAEGKTKIVLADRDDPALAVLVHKDAITAGDGARRHALPGKGALSGRTTANVMRLLAAAGIPTHFVAAPAADRTLVRRCAMIPVEVVVRRLATGSFLKRHAVAEGTRFDPPLVELFVKDDANHDPLVDAAWLEARGIAAAGESDEMAALARRAFAALERAWAEQGIQLVDLKLEFGRAADGRLLVADVVDNDSWRLWPDGRKEGMLDKQVYRNLAEVTDAGLERVLANYQKVAEMTDRFGVPTASGASEEDAGLKPRAQATTSPSGAEREDRSKPREACGVFGVWGAGTDVTRTTLLGLMALQHRGQESAGIAVLRDGVLRVARGMGRVDQIFRQEQIEALDGTAAIGHTRYSTMGGSRIENAQPVLVETAETAVTLAHNGNIANPLELRRLVGERGGEPATGSDSELLAWLIALGHGEWEERIRRMMTLAAGAYSLTILTPDALFAVRDPHGLRPLALGWRDGHWLVASESCALDTVGAELVRDVQPGEILRVDEAGLRSTLLEEPPPPALCVFEKIYFARPDSVLDGKTAFEARVAMGKELAREHPAQADLVIGVPDSGVPAAIGYAQALGLPLSEGLVKNRYVGRTFIEPDQHSRQAGIRLKFNPLRGAVKDKRVVVVDDSVVRGNTMPKIVEMLRRGGATAVHLRVSSPPIAHPCHFGIDMGERESLIAHGRDLEAIRRHLGADTLGYLSLDGLLRAVDGGGHCFGCLTGRYPVPIEGVVGKHGLERPDVPAGRLALRAV